MKYILSLIALVSLPLLAAEPVTISKAQQLAVWDEKKEVLKFEKGADPEDVANMLMKDYLVLAGKFQACQQQLNPPKPAKSEVKEKATQLKGK